MKYSTLREAYYLVPEGYEELKSFIYRNLSDDAIDELLSNRPEHSADFLKNEFPDQLRFWSNEELEEFFKNEFDVGEMHDEPMDIDSDSDYALASAGFGTDEDYGYFGEASAGESQDEYKEYPYRVILKNIDWDTGYEEGEYPKEVVDNLPKNVMVKVLAPDEDNALDRALDLTSDEFGFLIYGSDPQINMIRQPLARSTRPVALRPRHPRREQRNENKENKSLSLKEVFLREQGEGVSRYMSSISKQMARTNDPQYVADAHDKILQLLQDNEQNQQEALKFADPFLKFHFRIAWRDVQNGSLDPKSAPRGEDLLNMEQEKRQVKEKELQAKRSERAEWFQNLSPEEKAKMERQGAYGDPAANDPRGLGS